MSSSFDLPLEGVTLKYLARPIRSIVLQPLLTGALLAGRLYNPKKAEDIVAALSRGHLTLSTATQGLGVVVAFGVLYRLNRLLSRLTLNNWTSDHSWDWQKEVIVVTGGSSGIGALIARKLADRNARVVILDVNAPATTLSANISFYKTNVTSSKDIAEVAAKIRKEVGAPTVLVNNAGIGFCKPILDETEDQTRATFDVNVIAHFLLVKEFTPHMIERNRQHSPQSGYSATLRWRRKIATHQS